MFIPNNIIGIILFLGMLLTGIWLLYQCVTLAVRVNIRRLEAEVRKTNQELKIIKEYLAAADKNKEKNHNPALPDAQSI